MNPAEQQIKRIQEKLQQLLKEHHALKKENARLQKDLSGCKEQFNLQKQTTESLQEQVSILKLGATSMNEADKKELEKRINAYLKEIDRCISLLSH
jgi:regulator of replication initiation timing